MQSASRLGGRQFSDSISETIDANYTGMSLHERARPGLGIIEPCLPSPGKVPPSGFRLHSRAFALSRDGMRSGGCRYAS